MANPGSPSTSTEALLRMVMDEVFTDGVFTVVEARNADMAVPMLEPNLNVRVLITNVGMPGTINGQRSRGWSTSAGRQ